jgi:hypothetical protein
MHIATLWNLLKGKPMLNFLAKSSNPMNAKAIITRMILSTDMSKHFQNVL